jgi:hypothetical protein
MLVIYQESLYMMQGQQNIKFYQSKNVPKYKIKNLWIFNMSHPKLHGNSLDNNVIRNECS